VLKTYYAFGGSRVAMRSAAGGPLTYLYGDHPSFLRASLGSASLTADASGTKIAEQRYKPYGELKWSSGTMSSSFGFTGQRTGSYGTIYMSAREYLPALGRFVSADTIVPRAGNPRALIRDMCVVGNPLAFADPDGHAAFPRPWSWLFGGDAHRFSPRESSAMALWVSAQSECPAPNLRTS